jgi:hypothetical protein
MRKEDIKAIEELIVKDFEGSRMKQVASWGHLLHS